MCGSCSIRHGDTLPHFRGGRTNWAQISLFDGRLSGNRVRTAGTILSVATLFWGFLQAPFLHFHVEESEHPATALTHLHAHVSHKAPGPTIGAHAADEDALEVEWRITQPPTVGFTLDLAISEAVAVVPSQVVSAAVSIPQPRAHDPPDLAPKQPRAPPA